MDQRPGVTASHLARLLAHPGRGFLAADLEAAEGQELADRADRATCPPGGAYGWTSGTWPPPPCSDQRRDNQTQGGQPQGLQART